MRTNASRLDPTRFDDLHFDDAPAVSGPMPGPRSRELLDEQAELESRARSYPRSVPIALEEGRGATMRDVDGNTFIDFFGGAGTLNVGHSNPAVLAAAADQQQRLVHALDFPTRPRLRLLRRLKELLPGRLRRQRALPPRRADRHRRGRGGAQAHPRPHRPQRRDRLPGLLPRHGRDQRPLLRAARGDAGAVHALPLLLSLPARA